MPKRDIRPIRVEGNTAFITLTKGFEAIIDAEDVPLVGHLHWQAFVKSTTVYGKAGNGALLHRLVMGEPADMQVDHIDGNGLDNRKSNLRLATVNNNAHNRRIHRNNSCGLKGVHLTQRGQWRAQIKKNNVTVRLGYFPSAERAHEAYVKAARELHGEFARSK